LETDLNKGTVQLNDLNNQVAVDSLLEVLPPNLDSVIKAENIDTDFNFDFAALRDSNDLKSSLLILADQLEEKIDSTSDPKKLRKLKTYVQLCRSPEQAISRILKYVSYAFFLLLPIFALILKLFYIRRKQNYVKHLIFSIHLHSFWFLVAIIILLLFLIFKKVEGVIPIVLILWCGIYFIIALKKFYRQKTGKTILKWIGISFLYYFVFWSIVMAAMLNALSII